MQEDTKSALVEFIDIAINKGLVPSGTGRGWRAAVNAALEDLPEDAPLSNLDIDTELVKYSNRKPGAVSPDTLRRYKAWATAAVENFMNYRANPMSYRPRTTVSGARRSTATEARSGGKGEKGRKGKGEMSGSSTSNSQNSPQLQHQHVPPVATGAGMTLTFPLRSDFRAQVVIPSDMTILEAKRLGAFLMTLSQDYEP